MSTRDFMIAIKSIQPIREIVGSKDQALFDELLESAKSEIEEEFGPEDELDEDDQEEYDEQLDETKAELNQLIMADGSIKTEPGSWIYLIKRIIEIRDLATVSDFNFNAGYKHYYAWEPYRELVQKRISPEANEALQFLEHGRPLRGKKIDHDGSLFAWLTNQEAASLHDSLSQINWPELGDEELEDFHNDLVEALGIVVEEKSDLLLGAH